MHQKALLAQPAKTGMARGTAKHFNRAFSGRQEAGNQIQECGFTATRGTGQRNNVTPPERQRKLAEHWLG